MSSTFYCALSGVPCIDPVLSSTGYVFERQTILNHISTTPTCPITGNPLTVNDLYAPTIPSLLPNPITSFTSSPTSIHHSSLPPLPSSPSPHIPTNTNLDNPNISTLRRISLQSNPSIINDVYPNLTTLTMNDNNNYVGSPLPPPNLSSTSYPPHIPRVPSTASLRSSHHRPQSHHHHHQQQQHRSSWHQSTLNEPPITSPPSHRDSVALNAQVVDDARLIDQLASEDYRYSTTLQSNNNGQSSHDRLVAQLAILPTYRPWFVWSITLIQTVGLIWSLVWAYQTTGSPILTNPFNWMIGPSPDILVQMGARFAPCIRPVPTLNPTSTPVACFIPNGKPLLTKDGSITNPTLYQCSWYTLCGPLQPSSLSPTTNIIPNQWFRFITPIFLHAGIIHYLMNIIFQWTAVKSLERDWGWFRIAPVYLTSGIFGFIFGGSFTDPTSLSVGCSGALFGIVACLLIDHIQNWRIIHHPIRQLFRMLFVIILTFFLGLFPGIDNFSHIGGFIIGLLLGIVVMPNINLSLCNGSRKSISSDTDTNTNTNEIIGNKMKISMWGGYSVTSIIIRTVCLLITIAFFAAMIPLFYAGNGLQKCTWCKYIDCVSAFGTCSAVQTTSEFVVPQ